MKDIQISRPVLLALLAAVLAGGYVLYTSSQSEEVVPPTPAPTGTTGAGGPTGASGAKGKGATGKTGATGSAETRAEIRKRRLLALRKKAAEAGIPFDVYMARRRGKEIVIFFWEPRAKDDRRVKLAIDQVKAARRKLVVFRDRIGNKSRYDGIAEAAKITQTPGIVIVYRDKADSWQGFIDAGTLNERISRLTGRTVKY